MILYRDRRAIYSGTTTSAVKLLYFKRQAFDGSAALMEAQTRGGTAGAAG